MATQRFVPAYKNDAMHTKNFLPLGRNESYSKFMKTLLITNIKGGVAKSTTAVAVACGLKMLKPEANILLLDGDPQGSIKTYFGLKLGSAEDFSTFLIDDTPFENAIQKIKVRDVGEIDVMISSRKLAE